MAIKFTVDEKKEELKKTYEAKGEKPPKKLKAKKPKRQKLAITSLIVAASMTLLVVAYVALPFISILLGIIGYVAFSLIVILPTIVTLGMIWLNDGWKEWQANFANGLAKFMSSGSEISANLIPAFPYIAAFGGALIIGNLVFSIHIIRHPNPYETGAKGRLIVSIILCSVYVIFTIIDSVLIVSGAF
ncbi:MAG: hypothetical protein MJ208_02015 [Bacilli bacterium]|nr:hypothetical protein [Bacilli bacterium]